MRPSFLCLWFMLWATHAAAVTLDKPLPNALQEETAQALFHTLKCVVCEGQSLAESDATLAVQMRAHIRAMAQQGQSRSDILRYFRERYGDRILLAPPVALRTLPLWIAPFMLLLFGAWLVKRFLREGGVDRD